MALFRLSRALQINQMQILRTALREARRNCRRVFVIDRHTLIVAFVQAHGLASVKIE